MESKRARIEREKEERRLREEAILEFSAEELALATIPGADFDPTQRQFSLEELRPQPIIRKRRKVGFLLFKYCDTITFNTALIHMVEYLQMFKITFFYRLTLTLTKKTTSIGTSERKTMLQPAVLVKQDA